MSKVEITTCRDVIKDGQCVGRIKWEKFYYEVDLAGEYLSYDHLFKQIANLEDAYEYLGRAIDSMK